MLGHVGNGFYGVRGVGSIIIVQAHPQLAFGLLRDIGRQSPSKNMSALGAFVGPSVTGAPEQPY